MGCISKLLLAAACLAWLGSPPALSAPQPAVTLGKFHGVSQPLRMLPLPSAKALKLAPRVMPLGRPRPGAGASEATPSRSGLPGDGPGSPSGITEQDLPGAAAKVTSPVGLNVLGLGAGFPGYSICCVPPDTNAAVGATQVVEAVNLSIQVFDKTTGAAIGTPVALSALVTTGNNCQNGDLSDPVVLFDKINSRWVITYSAATSFKPLKGPFLQCFAVSKTSDATGSYNLYSFDVSTLGGLLPAPAANDYDKLGIWPDAYYGSFNEFDAARGKFIGAAPCAFQSSVMVAGGSSPVLVCFAPISTEDSLLPADMDGATKPPSGEPEFYLGTIDSGNSFHIWQFHVDFKTPANSTFSGPVNVKVNPFTEACGGGICVAQPEGGELLDSLADRLMHRAAYRNFGTHESIVVSHSVKILQRRTSASGIRWYELRSPGSSPFIFQQGTFAPDANFRWMPSIAMDKVGDIAVGYSVSGRRLSPSIRYTGRTPTLPLGQMSTEASIVAGSAVQFDSSHRWGDYSSMSIDPTDDCTFWYAQEYIQTKGTKGSFNWSTQLASFKFPGCM